MNEQITIFDAIESAKQAEAGIALAASHKPSLLAIARGIAVGIAEASPNRTCDADQVVRELERRNLGQLGNAAGSLFRGKAWEFTGQFKKSERVHAHSNLLRVWRLK